MMRSQLRHLFPSGSFARSVGILTGGTVGAQALAVMALPLLTRLYTPEDFELLAVYASILVILTTVASFRFNIAIPLPKEDADALALLVVALASGVLVSLLLAIPMLWSTTQTAAVLGQPRLEPYLWLIPVGVFAANSYDILQYWASRKRRFGLVTSTRVSRAFGGMGTQIAFGFSGASPFGLLFGHLVYSGLGVLGLAYNLLRSDFMALRLVDRFRIRSQIVAYRQFPTWSVSEALFNTAGAQLPLIIIAASTAGPEAGFLMLAIRVIGLPMGLIGSSVSQVFLAEAPSRLREGTLGDFTRRTMWTMFRIGAPPLILIGIVSPQVLPWVLGSDWGRVGLLVAWMIPWSILEFVASPVMRYLHTAGKLRTAFFLQFFGGIVRVGSVVLAVQYAPVLGESLTIQTMIASNVLYYSICIAIVLSFTRNRGQ